MFKIIIITLSISLLCHSDQLENVINCVRSIKGANISTRIVTGRDGNRYLLIPASSTGTKGGTSDKQTTPSGMPPSPSRTILSQGSDANKPDLSNLLLSTRIPLSPSRAALSPSSRSQQPSLSRRIPLTGVTSRALPIPGWGMPSGVAPPLSSVAKGVTLKPGIDSVPSVPPLLPRVDSSWWDRLRDGSVTTVRPQIAAPLVSNNTLYRMWQSFLDSSPPTKTVSGSIAPFSNDKLLNMWPEFHWNQLRPELLADIPSLTRDGLNTLWNQFLRNQPQTMVTASTPEESFERLNKLWQTFQNDVLSMQQQMQFTEAPPTKTKPSTRPIVNEPLYRIWSEFANQRKAQNNDTANNDDLNRWWLELLWSQQKPQLTAAYPGLSADKLYKLWLSYLRNEPEINLSVDPPDIAYERLYGRWARFLRFLQSNANQLDITQPIVQQSRDDDTSTKGGTKARRLPNEWLYRLWQRYSNKQSADSDAPVTSDDIYNWWPQFAWTYQRPQLNAINPTLTDDRLRTLWNRFLSSQTKIDLSTTTPENTYTQLFKLWSSFLGTLQDQQSVDATTTESIIQQSKDVDGMVDLSNDPVYRSWENVLNRETAKDSAPLTNDRVSDLWTRFLWDQEEPQLTAAYPWMTSGVLRSVWNDFIAMQPQKPDLVGGSPELSYETLNQQLWPMFSRYLQDNGASIGRRYADVGVPVAQVRQQNTFDDTSDDSNQAESRSGDVMIAVSSADNEVLKHSTVNVTEKPTDKDKDSYGLYEFIDVHGNKRMIKYLNNGNDTARAIMFYKNDSAVDESNVDDVIFGRV